MDIVRDTIRHNSWATRRLIEHLTSLDRETLELSAPGTYGQIGATLAHMLRAEGAYLARLRGEAPQPRQPGHEDLEAMAADAELLRQGWEHLLQAGLDPDASVPTIRGVQTAGTILAQVINHGAEHRAHVCTVLGAHGIQPPALDPFAFAEMAR
jgi:uncharacterized damage-inducible protein DinB